MVQGCADNHASRRAYVGKLTIIFAFSECSMMTINNNMGLTVLGLFIHNIICLLQVWPSSSRFAFEFQLLRVDVLNDENCDDFTVSQEARGRCEPFLGDFCLREGRNTQLVTPDGRDQ